MIIGVDFDNTIVCYDRVFHQVALKQDLIPAGLPISKGKVRDYLRQRGKEAVWIEMQGYVYGACMQDAIPYPGVVGFCLACKKRDIPLYIISHKTHYPFDGPHYNLHEAAQMWLDRYGFYDPSGIGLAKNHVYFDLTKQEKLNRITQMACTHFVDDLPEFLLEGNFPLNVERVLFDPNHIYPTNSQYLYAISWTEIQEALLER